MGFSGGAAGAARFDNKEIRMRSPLYGLEPPFTLRSNIVYFHDWRYVSTGGFGWLGPAGNQVVKMGPEPVPQMHYRYDNMPLGVRLKAQPATRSEMVLGASRIGECRLTAGSLIHEDGVYRLWYESLLSGVFKEGMYKGRYDALSNSLKYAESTDGINWKLPNVANKKLTGRKNRNIVFGAALSPSLGYHGGCVFKDAHAPTKERYKTFYLGRASVAMIKTYQKKWPDDVPPEVLALLRKNQPSAAMLGATSPDGITWKAIREPLLFHTSDTHQTCEYDPALGKYVAYIRITMLRRRSIGRSVSDDFRHFQFPEVVFWPDASQKAYNTWYCNGKTTMPGTPDYHIMFPMRWDLTRDRFSFHLAASPDNVTWGFVPGDAVCEPGATGSWDGGGVWPGHGMVELPGNRMGVLYCGSPAPHKHPRRPPYGDLGWAYWEKGRLVALEAEEEGAFAFFPLIAKGRSVSLNARTAMTGHIQVEALDKDGNVLPGRSFDDCDRICGDFFDRIVTWRSESDLGHKEGTAVTLRFQLRNAELFSVEFKE